MTPENFCYWLKGYFEVEALISNKPEKPTLTDAQVLCVKQHLDYVFAAKTVIGGPTVSPSPGSYFGEALSKGAGALIC